jgi:DNA-nicking Smr family endonuclease
MKLDLHGIKHQDVVSVVDSFIWENMQNNTSHIEIITGKSTVMKEIVKECLLEYGFTCNPDLINDGSLFINLTQGL